MPNLNGVDRAHSDLHVANDALEQAIADETAAQAVVDDLQLQLTAAQNDLEQKTNVRINLTAEYNDACGDLANEAEGAKVVDEPNPAPATRRTYATSK